MLGNTQPNIFKVTALTVLCYASFAQAEEEGPGKVPLGNGVNLIPVLTVTEKYDDNIFSAETLPKSSWITVFSPSLALEAESKANKFSLTYLLESAFYHDSSTDDYLDHFVDGGAHIVASKRIRFDLRGGYHQSHDDRGTGLSEGAGTGVTKPDKWDDWNAGASIDLGAQDAMFGLILDGDYVSKRFSNNLTTTASRDLDRINTGVTLLYQVMPKTALIAHVTYDDLKYKTILSGGTDLDSQEYRYHGGLMWEATAKTTGRIEVGYQQKKFAAASRTDFSGISWEGAITWKPQTYSTLDFITSTKSTESNGTGDVIENKDVTVIWAHQWGKRLSHDAMVYFARNDYPPTTRRDNLLNAGFGLNYQLLRWLGIGARYDYSKRSTNEAGSNYKRNTYSLNLTGTL